MKKFIKVCAIAGGICLAVGAGISITAYALGASVKDYSIYPHRFFKQGRFITDMIFDETGTVKNEHSFKGVKALSLDLSEAYVEILSEGEGDEIKITFEGKPGDNFQCDMDGSRLDIEWNIHRQRFVTDVLTRKVRIVVPEGYTFDDVDLDMSAAELTVQNLNAGQLKADVKAATIDIGNGSVDILKADVKAGEMLYQGAVLKEAGVDCKAGSMTLDLSGKETDFNYRIDCKMGDIEIGGASYSGMNFEKTVQNNAQKQISLDCKTGDVKVRFQE